MNMSTVGDGMKIYKMIIETPHNEKTFYIESDNEFGNPLYDHGELIATGYKTFLVSKDISMEDAFQITVTPNLCSIIEFHEM